MKRFLIIAVTSALLCGFACAQEQAIETVVTQQAVVVPSPNTQISKTVFRGPFGFVRARSKSICTNCAPVQACAPAVQACAPAVEACAPAVEACAPVVTTPACAPVVASPACIKTCLNGIAKSKTVIKKRPRILPDQVIRTRTVVR